MNQQNWNTDNMFDQVVGELKPLPLTNSEFLHLFHSLDRLSSRTKSKTLTFFFSRQFNSHCNLLKPTPRKQFKNTVIARQTCATSHVKMLHSRKRIQLGN